MWPRCGPAHACRLENMLRIYFLQQWFNLSDPQAEDAIYDSEAMRRFARVELGNDVVPDETTILRGPPWRARRRRGLERLSAHSTRESDSWVAHRAVERLVRHCHHPAAPGLRAPLPPWALAMARPPVIRRAQRSVSTPRAPAATSAAGSLRTDRRTRRRAALPRPGYAPGGARRTAARATARRRSERRAPSRPRR
jgi:Transposase domain (DUF772)